MKIKILALIFLAAVALGAFYFFSRPVRPPRPAAPSQLEIAAAQLESGEISIVKGQKPAAAPAGAAAATGNWRDPFYLPGKGGRAAPAQSYAPAETTAPAVRPERLPELNGIIDGAEGFQAFIDGEVVATGDSVSGYRVQSIEANKVTLAREDKTIVLRLE